MSLGTKLRDATFRWIADDPDPATRTELQTVLARAMTGDAAATADLADRMAGPLTFGTAGLRGPVRAGPNGMNRAVVIRTTYGLVSWLAANGHRGGTVIVGRDARHGSEQFCADVAAVLTAAGFTAQVLPRPLPTPVLAYAVRQRKAIAGVQITASHNPPADNGYKLYTDGGAQIVPPADRQIERAIAAAPAAVSIELGTRWTTLDESIVDAYLDRAAAVRRGTAGGLRIALTPLHGVGGATAVAALRRAGFTEIEVVPTQAEPDPDFPTVAFPNPEEPGASDALLALAAASGADLAVALDPDADRCALGVAFPDGWRMLTGDESGALLAAHLLSTVDTAATQKPLVATTIVSAELLHVMAEAAGVRYAETPTGFKWLARTGEDLIFAYEEALGLCVDPDAVRDKDGISAAVLAADLAASLKAAGRTLPGLLDALAASHGVYLTGQVSLRFTDLPAIAALLAKIRDNPPATLTGAPVTFEDLRPEIDALRLRANGIRVVIRPSGTEPKLKTYLQVTEPVPDAAALPAARERAVDRMTWLRAEITGLLGQ